MNTLTKLSAEILETKVVAIVMGYDYDSEQEYHNESFTTIGDILSEGEWEDDDISEGVTVDEIVSLINQGEYQYVRTLASYEKERAEKERMEIEHVAADFARKCGHGVGTVGYIKAIRAAITRHQDEVEVAFSGESKMERMAACQFAGCGGSYYEDEDYIQSKYSQDYENLQRVLTWIEDNCPLLALKVSQETED